MGEISEEARDFLERIEMMSQKNREAFETLFNNFDTIWMICETCELTPEEREDLLERANEWDDPVLRLVVQLEEYLHQ